MKNIIKTKIIYRFNIIPILIIRCELINCVYIEFI